ncbi:MAG: spore germination protein [Oscillospiraceae bacterium]|nr:spore germination protein [Oscillospiraceae bacterium]
MFNSLFENNTSVLDKLTRANDSFDIIKRVIKINKRKSAIYFIDGLLKDDIMEKLMEFFYKITDDSFFESADSFMENCVPYVEVNKSTDTQEIVTALLSGIALITIDGIKEIILLDTRTYPQRETAEPQNDKVLRGSKDGFTEIFIHNCVLIRRRIRDKNLTITAMQAGKRSKTDVALVYMVDKVDKNLLNKIQKKIKDIDSMGLTMTQQGFVEALINQKWLNPFPKVKYSERPDSTAANVLKGNIAIIVDNSPSAIIIPTSVFDLMEEADDYYFPPITGTYLRLSRYFISLLSLFVTPLWLLGNQMPQLVPDFLKFTIIDEPQNISLFWQLILIEIAIDGLRLASINTPEMLSTTIGIIGGIALSEFAVDAGFAATETILYMAFVAIANYSQPSQELSYSIKFFRIILLVLTRLLSLWGLLGGTLLIIVMLATNKTLSGKSYLYPLFPLKPKELFEKFVRTKSK